MIEVDYSKTQGTVCFLIKDQKVLLVEKGRNLGKGKLVGVGGKQEPGETLEETIVRETKEEIGVTIHSPQKVAECDFIFPNNPKYGQLVSAYLVYSWEGKPKVTDEAKTLEWFPFDSLPTNRMWHDNTIWLPLVLAGKKVRGKYLIGEDERVYEYKLEEVKSF